MGTAELGPPSKPCAHTLSLSVGQMQAQALSVVSKQIPESVSQWHARAGFRARSKPGLHTPSFCDGNGSAELVLPAPPLAVLVGAGALGSGSPEPESSMVRPPQANRPKNPNIESPSCTRIIVPSAMCGNDRTDHCFGNLSRRATR